MKVNPDSAAITIIIIVIQSEMATAIVMTFDGCATPGVMARAQGACCPPACGKCGGDGCEARQGGRALCCTTAVLASMRNCSEGPPCVLDLPQYRALRAYLDGHPGERARRLTNELARYPKVGSAAAAATAADDQRPPPPPSSPSTHQMPPTRLPPQLRLTVLLLLGCFALGSFGMLSCRVATVGWGAFGRHLLSLLMLTAIALAASVCMADMRHVQSLDRARLTTAHVARRPPWSDLAPRAYKPLPLGVVTPRGWLATQLLLQAEGLSGHLARACGGS